MIPRIKLNTHPGVDMPKPWSVNILANKQKTTHSATLVVPPTNTYIQIVPSVPIALTGRMYRLFVSVNGQKTLEVSRAPFTAGPNGASPDPNFENGKKKGEPHFVGKLVGGVNRIEVEIVAEKERKDQPESSNPKDQLDVEKCTIFLHLMEYSSN